jgi:hypothetical protein
MWWIRARLGLDKRWFVVSAWPVVSRSFYFFLPTFVLGFAILILSIVLFTTAPDNDLGFIFAIPWILWGLGFVFAFLEPNWMSPAWYRWLKKNHRDIMPYLVLDAHEMGRKAWVQRVESQDGLESWATEVRHKYIR